MTVKSRVLSVDKLARSTAHRATSKIYTTVAIPSKYVIIEDEGSDKDVSAVLSPNKDQLRGTNSPGNEMFYLDSDDDATLWVSKLADQELNALLQKQSNLDNLNKLEVEKILKSSNKKTRSKNKKDDDQSAEQDVAYFKLDNKEVEPSNFNIGVEPSYLAHQKVQNLLYSQPARNFLDLDSDETDEKKELLFDILTAQLKKLCCRSTKAKKNNVKLPSYEPLLSINNNSHDSKNSLQYEQMFLIINDEIKGDQDADIIEVDPESLSENSSVLLLGPITTPLTDYQLKIVMNRITSELSKPEYNSLLQELSEGKVDKTNTRLVKGLVSGSNTRRYIKPHRCNQRYPQALNPKWYICTGYLNLNNPSIYD